eukprot:750414-Hanusia_phi.AAC.5
MFLPQSPTLAVSCLTNLHSHSALDFALLSPVSSLFCVLCATVTLNLCCSRSRSLPTSSPSCRHCAGNFEVRRSGEGRRGNVTGGWWGWSHSGRGGDEGARMKIGGRNCDRSDDQGGKKAPAVPDQAPDKHDSRYSFDLITAYGLQTCFQRSPW